MWKLQNGGSLKYDHPKTSFFSKFSSKKVVQNENVDFVVVLAVAILLLRLNIFDFCVSGNFLGQYYSDFNNFFFHFV